MPPLVQARLVDRIECLWLVYRDGQTKLSCERLTVWPYPFIGEPRGESYGGVLLPSQFLLIRAKGCRIIGVVRSMTFSTSSSRKLLRSGKRPRRSFKACPTIGRNVQMKALASTVRRRANRGLDVYLLYIGSVSAYIRRFLRFLFNPR
jgi:hypothetical protein